MKLKSLFFSFVMFLSAGAALAQTALTIDAGNMASSATLHVTVFANDMTTFDVVGKTLPINVSNSSGIISLALEDIQWDGAPPGGDWGWGYAEVKLSCGTPYQAGAQNICGSYNINGMSIGCINYPEQDCFEVANATCGDTGDTVSADMGNSGRERPAYPAVITIE